MPITLDGTTGITTPSLSGPLNGTVGATTPSTGAFTTLDATGVTTLQAGTAALPALTTSGDTNTGIFFPTADTIALSTAGTERARITSGGSLRVGSTAAVGSSTEIAGFKGTRGISSLSTGGANFGAGFFWNEATSGDNLFLAFGSDAGGDTRGTITYNRAAGLTSYNTTSDYRAKDISGPVTDSGVLIDSVPVYMGKMKGATQERPMFIAHETPAYTHTGEKDAVDADGNPVYQQMDASSLIPVMWAEIQSLRKRLADAGIV